jgi:hypothetical protein
MLRLAVAPGPNSPAGACSFPATWRHVLCAGLVEGGTAWNGAHALWAHVTEEGLRWARSVMRGHAELGEQTDLLADAARAASLVAACASEITEGSVWAGLAEGRPGLLGHPRRSGGTHGAITAGTHQPGGRQ